jgi:hypothetical protein
MRGAKPMKVAIKQTKYCYCDEQIFKDYPILEKYRDRMDYYTGYDDGTNFNYWSEHDYSQYYSDNAIVIDLNNDELVKLLQELMNESHLVIGWANKYDHKTYGVDFIVEIYDDWRE